MLYRVATWGPVPRRHEAAAAQLPAIERQGLVWAVLIREDGAQAEALLVLLRAPKLLERSDPATRLR